MTAPAGQGDYRRLRAGFDFVARPKYDAWEARRGVSKDAAMRGYVMLVQHQQSPEG